MSNETHGRAKLLVVDDEKLICLAMTAKLRHVGYEGIAVDNVDAAVAMLKEHKGQFRAVITDIMMGDMDGFVFRDIVRGIEPSMPMFFMTALDPEEGSGFLKKILDDPLSFYLPKSAGTDVMLKRVQALVASYRVQHFIEEKMDEQRKALKLAASVQKSMLPMRAKMLRGAFYSAWWRPVELVSGDLYEAVPFGDNALLYIMGDIQGHGTSSALAMTAIQAYLKNLRRQHGATPMEVEDIANMLQTFFRTNLADVSYMTALICIHDIKASEVRWLSCGAPDLIVIDPAAGCKVKANPTHKGNLPIGLVEGTVYTEEDVVKTPLGPGMLCMAYSDGIMDLTRDGEGLEPMPMNTLSTLLVDIACSSRRKGESMTIPHKLIMACQEYGYGHFHDDVTGLVFGMRIGDEEIYTDIIDLLPAAINDAAIRMADWCAKQGWGDDFSTRIQLVLEETLMNIHDHAFSATERIRESVGLRLVKRGKSAALTVWDCGTPPPSIEVAAGDSGVAFELANRDFSGRGRGRLIVRQMCVGIERCTFGVLNETTFHVPFDASEAGKPDGEEQ